MGRGDRGGWGGDSGHGFERGLFVEAIPHFFSSMRGDGVVVSITYHVYNLLRRYNDSPYTFIANTHGGVGLCNICGGWRHLYFHSVGPGGLHQDRGTPGLLLVG